MPDEAKRSMRPVAASQRKIAACFRSQAKQLPALSKAMPSRKPSVPPMRSTELPSAASRRRSPVSVPHQIEPSRWTATPSGCATRGSGEDAVEEDARGGHVEQRLRHGSRSVRGFARRDACAAIQRSTMARSAARISAMSAPRSLALTNSSRRKPERIDPVSQDRERIGGGQRQSPGNRHRMSRQSRWHRGSARA